MTTTDEKFIRTMRTASATTLYSLRDDNAELLSLLDGLTPSALTDIIWVLSRRAAHTMTLGCGPEEAEAQLIQELMTLAETDTGGAE